MQDVFITGGAGFLGSALARALVGRGRRVVCLDIAGFDRLADLAGHPLLRCVHGDVCDPEGVERLVAEAGSVVHMAAVVGVDRYARDPLAVFDVNVGGTRNVLAACARLGRPALLASTSEVYGRLPWDLAEDGGGQVGDLAQGRWSYSLSKAVSEQIAGALAASAALAFTTARYFNVYGPTLDRPGEGRVISRFIGQLQQGAPLTLVDGGAAVRCFCYLDDAIDATVGLLEALERGEPAAVGRAFNVGRREPVTMRELARRMAALAGHGAGTVDVAGATFFGPGFQEIPRRVPIVTALRDAIGFEARTPLDEGLRRVLASYGLLRRPEALADPEPLPMVRPIFAPDAGLVTTMLAALHSGRVTNHGPEVQGLERDLAGFLHVDEVAACGSGTAGLTAALVALGLQGRAVLPAFTYAATLNAVLTAGFEPVFADIDPATWTLDPTHLHRLLGQHADIAVVLPVNVFGVPADLPLIAALSRAAGAVVVCDDAHAMGTEDARSVAIDVRVFSLHATKILPAVEGGAVVARDPTLLREVRRLLCHGLDTADPLRSGPGFNFKLSELHAAVGRHSLTHLPQALARRREYAARLRASLGASEGNVWQVQAVPAGVLPNFQNLGVRLRGGVAVDVEAVRERLAARGIEARRYFWPPLHALQRFGGAIRLPVTDELTRHQLCLPLHSQMDEAQVRRIEQAARAVVAGGNAWIHG